MGEIGTFMGAQSGSCLVNLRVLGPLMEGCTNIYRGIKSGLQLMVCYHYPLTQLWYMQNKVKAETTNDNLKSKGLVLKENNLWSGLTFPITLKVPISTNWTFLCGVL
jgi:hypothetical protein